MDSFTKALISNLNSVIDNYSSLPSNNFYFLNVKELFALVPNHCRQYENFKIPLSSLIAAATHMGFIDPKIKQQL